MLAWRYSAVGDAGARRCGTLLAPSAADARAALRGDGLRVLRLRADPVHALRERLPGMHVWRRHLRTRRAGAKCDLYDGLATLLGAGLPLLEALQAIEHSTMRMRAASRLTATLGDALRSGQSLDEAMAGHPTWFDDAEIAMVRAGRHAGELERVLRSLADRHARSGRLEQKLTAALAYPALVACVGLGVTVFLSVKTLPELSSILTESDVPVPRLTSVVMSAGQAVAHHGLLLIAGLIAAGIVVGLAWRWLARRSPRARTLAQRCLPPVARRLALAHVASSLSELLRAGVPFVEALRIIAPTVHTPGGAQLRLALDDAAARVERGEELGDVFSDPLWFDAEFRRLVSIGQASGELDNLLGRLAERLHRQSAALIDRLAGMLEPAAILALAVGVGTVVMAAVLPLIRLQEII